MREHRTILSLILCVLVVFFIAGESSEANILATKHNLSASGPGTIKAVDENRVCIFCHTPHHATSVAPLWSRSLSNAIYNLYGSSTLVAQPGQPTGASRLCLSCHDGTIAIGMLDGAAETIPLTGGITTMPQGLSNLETDLSDDHPISFAYTQALAVQRGELKDPSVLPYEVQLEDGDMLQCTSCHNPHKNPHGMFLVMNNQGSALCLACHEKEGWSTSAHATDLATAGNGCQNCHQPHGAESSKHLLIGATEEDTCLTSCHNGAGVGVDIKSDIDKYFRHPVNFATGVHDITEDPTSMDKHVECVDCHNPHQVNNQGAPLNDPSNINGRLLGVKGVDQSGLVVDNALHEYEICFKCHSGTGAVGTDQVTRHIQTGDERLRFAPENPSFHPVLRYGKSSNVPSLRPEFNISSQIYCSDCHGSDSSAKVGGLGADGPHGSIHPHILLARYEQDNYPLSYSVNNYALCFRCHDPDVLFSSLTTFGNGQNSSHQTHVVGKRIPCSICHDPHGVPFALGATREGNSRLINFDLRFVERGGTFDIDTKSCTVSCHQGNNGTHSY